MYLLLSFDITFFQRRSICYKLTIYNEGKEKLSEEERYLLGLVEENNDFSKELGKDLDIMIEYVNAAGEVTMGTNFGEAYDKEWALLD